MLKQNAVTVPSDQQINRLCGRVFETVLRPGGITRQQLEAVLVRPDLADELVAAILRCAKIISGIVAPVRAQDTGLIPDGWTVKSDNLEGDINLTDLDYSSCLVREGQNSVRGDVILERAGNAYGSLGFAVALLKAQDEGKEIFPVESRGKNYFIMPRNILFYRRRRVAYFYWLGGRWVLDFDWIDNDFRGSDRFVRPRE